MTEDLSAKDAEDSLRLNPINDFESDRTDKPVYCVRQGVVFIIDATEPMFEIDPITATSYFSQCLEACKNILSEKLSWNTTDQMGIILMGTNKWDQDPEIKHVLSWLPFQEVSIDQRKKLDKALSDIETFHSEIGSSKTYPLHDALWHASRCFSTVKIKMPYRRIVLFTKSDDPFSNNQKEGYRIRMKAKDCSDMHVPLTVVGLGEEWKPEHFFAELEVHSGKFKTVDDYQRTFLTDMVEEVKHPSRISAKFEWELGGDVKLGVAMSSIISKTKFPRKIHLKKENNEPLDRHTFYKAMQDNDSENEVSEDEGDQERIKSHVSLEGTNVWNYVTYGGRKIKFTKSETQNLKKIYEPGIKLLGFKPRSALTISYHIEPPQLITYDERTLEGSKALFACLLAQCIVKNVMPICVITSRPSSSPNLFALIPDSTYEGFYAYRLPTKENLRDTASLVGEYLYDKQECPIDKKTVDLCRKVIKKSTIAYEPTMFRNPKLHTELASIESMALDEDSLKAPPDTTIPDKEVLCERLGSLKDEFESAVRIHDTVPLKRPADSALGGPNKNPKVEEEFNFEQLVRDKLVEKRTVKQLKDYLQSVGVEPVGRKNELVNAVYSFFDKS